MVDMNCDIYEDEEYIMMKYGFWGWNSFCTDDLQVSANRTLCWTSEEWKASIWIWQTLLVNFICHHQCGRHHHFHWKWNASILLWHPSLFLYNMLIFSYQIKVEVINRPPITLPALVAVTSVESESEILLVGVGTPLCFSTLVIFAAFIILKPPKRQHRNCHSGDLCLDVPASYSKHTLCSTGLATKWVQGSALKERGHSYMLTYSCKCITTCISIQKYGNWKEGVLQTFN